MPLILMDAEAMVDEVAGADEAVVRADAVAKEDVVVCDNNNGEAHDDTRDNSTHDSAHNVAHDSDHGNDGAVAARVAGAGKTQMQSIGASRQKLIMSSYSC